MRFHLHVGEAPVAKKKEDVHVPAKNIADIKSAEKVKSLCWFFESERMV